MPDEGFSSWLQSNRDSWFGTFFVALTLCLVCSGGVALTAVSLRDWQNANKAIDRKKNVLLAAGFADQIQSSDDVNRIFEQSIRKELVDVSTGKALSDDQLTKLGVDPQTYDVRKAAKDASINVDVQAGALPGISKRAPLAEVYKIVDGEQVQGYIFPIYGNGLWSTLYGFLALAGDGQTVLGVTYYEHKETPGLGGEVENKKWKASWAGKKVYRDGDSEVALTVLKGRAAKDDAYAIDGLSGATITSKGVDNMVKYWMGTGAFGKYLANEQGHSPSSGGPSDADPSDAGHADAGHADHDDHDDHDDHAGHAGHGH